MLTELAEVEVLAIDELGKGRLSDWELTIIDEVVSRRYNAMGCTPLATTNYVPGNSNGRSAPNLSTTQTSGQTLGDRVGDRVYSRLLQLVDFVEVAGATTAGPPYTDQRRLPFFLRPGRVILSRRSRTSSAFRRAHERLDRARCWS